MAHKRLFISQSNYIPWKGYFDAIASADEYVILDTVQYSKNDWRNRNKIKTSQGLKWLTIPIRYEYPRNIDQIVIADPSWAGKHWHTLASVYGGSRCYPSHKALLEDIYLNCKEPYLSRINEILLRRICEFLGITTTIRRADEFTARIDPNLRLIDICQQAGATDYLSGPSARAYLDRELFLRHGISVHFLEFSGYPEYPQRFPPFAHDVSIVDLIFNAGDDARHLFRRGTSNMSLPTSD